MRTASYNFCTYLRMQIMPIGTPFRRLLALFPKTFPRASALMLFPILLSCPLLAQQETAQTAFAPYSHPATPPPENPKVGLVLEGGGALGLAHVGVLKWLEEHHIPISYIAGTTMGGLVSGVYATGHNPAETLALINGINWDQVLAGQTPFQDLSFRRKEDAVE